MDYKKYAFLGGTVVTIAVAVLSLTMAVSEYKSWGRVNGQLATITVSGEGEVTATPDIATITFTVRETKKTVPEAQKAVETKVDEVLKAVKTLGVNEKDTKTLSYTVNPKYETQGTTYCTNGYCPQAKQVLVGYDVANTIQVKVRKVDIAGDVIAAVGNASITEVSGPDFTVDDREAFEAEAKEKAIEQAKEKATKLARSLGVSLGSISQFSEGGSYQPAYYRAEVMMAKDSSMGMAGNVSVPQGENVIKAYVTITYTLD